MGLGGLHRAEGLPSADVRDCVVLIYFVFHGGTASGWRGVGLGSPLLPIPSHGTFWNCEVSSLEEAPCIRVEALDSGEPKECDYCSPCDGGSLPEVGDRRQQAPRAGAAWSRSRLEQEGVLWEKVWTPLVAPVCCPQPQTRCCQGPPDQASLPGDILELEVQPECH